MLEYVKPRDCAREALSVSEGDKTLRPGSESDIRTTYDNAVLEVSIPLPDETRTASRKIPAYQEYV